MPVIKVNDLQHALHPGQNRLGGDDDEIPVDGDGFLGTQAVVDLALNDSAVIRREADASVVRVNGIALVDPTPLLHGDKIEVGGTALYYYDDSKVGATSFVSASDVAALARRPVPPRATASTGGRLVSLVDGKEYLIGDEPLTMGRDAACSVVVALNEASRKHAQVFAVDGGYEIRDFSANGLFVNGERVNGSRVLSRADVIRIGTEEFRFYADVAPARPAPAIDAPAAASPGAPPVAPPVDARPVLARLDVTNDGPTKGQCYEVLVPLAHVGRGAHNDVVIADESVSETHAKLQLRDNAWYLVDMESTNGTYVRGKRLVAERRLDGPTDVRFGGVTMSFTPHAAVADSAVEPRATAQFDGAAVTPLVPQSAADTSVEVPPKATGLPAGIWIAAALAVAGAAAFFLLKR